MAEQVEIRLEDMKPEMESMKKCGIFTESDIRDIIIKRKLYEYKLQKISKSKEDVLRYITYEIELLMKVKHKAKEKGLQQKTTSLEYMMANRISNLYYLALKRFPSDCKIWLSFVKFCKHVKMYHFVSQLFDQMLDIHGDKPILFKMAANWEFYECRSIERARKFILKGLHAHKDSKLLFTEAFRIELSYADQKLEKTKGSEEKEKNNSLAVPLPEKNLLDFIYTSAINKIEDVSFFVDLLKTAQEFSFTTSLQDKIIERIKSKYPNEEVTWDTLARRELILDGTEQEKIGRCITVYEEGLRLVPTRKMWSLYLNYVVKLNEDLTTLPVLKKKCLKNAFEMGYKENMLSEKHYLMWIKKVEDVDACKVLQWATEKLTSSNELWSWRLRYHLSKCDEKGAMCVFREIKSHPNIPDQASLWMIVLKSYQIIDPARAESLWIEGVNNNIVGAALKGRYIEWLAVTKGIIAARRAYSTLSTTPPFSLDLHEAMSKLEDAQPKVNMKCIRQVYDTAVNQYGKSNTDVWFWYLKFEAKFGEPEQVLNVYGKAIKTLDYHLVNIFISEYQLNQAEITNNASYFRPGKSLKHPKEEDTWNFLAKRELELNGTLEKRIRKCISVYEDGLRNIPTKAMWLLYLDYIVEINEDLSDLPAFKTNSLKKAFEAAHKANMLSENHYLLWITKVDDVDACRVMQLGVEKFGSKLWGLRLRYHLSKYDEAGAMVVFKEIVAQPNIPDKASLWMLVLDYYQIADVTKAESLWKEGVSNPTVAAVLRGRYIEWLAMTKGITAAREAYSALSTTPPFSLDIHIAMSKLEDAQPTVNVKYTRKVYEIAVNQYGKSNSDVWLWYIKFEAKFGEPERVPKIYDQAVKTLNNHLVDIFISEYHLNEAETIINERGKSYECPIEITWDTLARRELELRGRLEESNGSSSNDETSNGAQS